MGKNRKSVKVPLTDSAAFSTDAFAVLDQLHQLPPGPEPAPPEVTAPPATVLTLRRERKGRGGKEVTIAGGLLALEPAAADALAAAARKHLNTGGTRKGDELELQGDQRRRLTAWLQQRGFRVRGETG